jgi:hypothetical protein
LDPTVHSFVLNKKMFDFYFFIDHSSNFNDIPVTQNLRPVLGFVEPARTCGPFKVIFLQTCLFFGRPKNAQIRGFKKQKKRPNAQIRGFHLLCLLA